MGKVVVLRRGGKVTWGSFASTSTARIGADGGGARAQNAWIAMLGWPLAAGGNEWAPAELTSGGSRVRDFRTASATAVGRVETSSAPICRPKRRNRGPLALFPTTTTRTL